jgi:phasin family protein
MSKTTTPFEMPAHMRAMTEQAMDHMRDVMNKYLQFAQQGMSVWPGGQTELTKKAMTYAEQNVANSFDLAKKLMVAKSLEDVMRLQTEFAQAQVQALTDQAKDLAEAATKAAAESAKNPFAGTHR